jgi:hypothetical protein
MNNQQKFFIIRFVHSIIYFLMVACLSYLAYCAIAGRYDWTLLIALGAITVEGLVLLFNRGACPMTPLAGKYSDQRGSVTDLFLPDWCARHTFTIATIVFIIEVIWLASGYLVSIY